MFSRLFFQNNLFKLHKFIIYLNFLTRITDTITNKLPKMAARIIETIIEAFTIRRKVSNPSISCVAMTELFVASLSDIVEFIKIDPSIFSHYMLDYFSFFFFCLFYIYNLFYFKKKFLPLDDDMEFCY